MTLTLDLPASVQVALEADAKVQGKPVAAVLTDRLALSYGLATPLAPAPSARTLRDYGLLAATGLTSDALLAERRQEVDAE